MKPRKRFSPKVLAEIVLRQGGKCACGCGEKLVAGKYDFDHARELWDEGEDSPDNLRALIRKHHLIKTSRQTKQRAKLARIAAQDGLRKPKLSARDRQVQRIIEKQEREAS